MNSKKTLLRLCDQAIGVADDNIYRARLASRGHPLNEEYGQSGLTLEQIIQGYEDGRTEYVKAKESLGVR